MSNNVEIQEPEGIKFFSIRTGETHFGKLEPTIAAYINSSDLGINASRGQDYGWRLHPEWVKKIREFRKDRSQMSILTAKNGGQKPTLTQILYYMYGEQLQQFFEAQEDNENPYEDAYAEALASGKFSNVDEKGNPQLPQALADFLAANDDDEEEISDDDDISDLIDDVITEDETTELTEDEQKAAEELAKMDAENEEKKTRATRSQKKQ